MERCDRSMHMGVVNWMGMLVREPMSGGTSVSGV
jgi:hypothetical protein